MGFFKYLFNKGNKAENNTSGDIVPENTNTELTESTPTSQIQLETSERPLTLQGFDGDGENGFRGNKWGASKESIINNETLEKLKSENDDELAYKTVLFGMPCTVHYFFFKNKLYEGYYSIQIKAEKNEGSYDKWFNQKSFGNIPKIEYICDYRFMKTYAEVRESLCSVLGDPSKGNEKNSLWQKILRRNPKKNTRECVDLYLKNEYELSATWDYLSTRERLLRQISLDILNVKLDYSEVYLQIMYFFPDVAFDTEDGADFVKQIDDNIKRNQEKHDDLERQMEEAGLSPNEVLLDGFRDNNWGDSRDDVYDIESSEFEYDLGDSFSYKGNHFGLPCFIMFKFDDEGLYQGLYGFQIDGNLRQCIVEYKRIGGLLQKEYGDPIKGSITNAFWNEGDRKYFGKDEEDQFSNGVIWYHADWKCGNTGVFESLSLSEEGNPRLGIMYYDYYKSQLRVLDELDE